MSRLIIGSPTGYFERGPLRLENGTAVVVETDGQPMEGCTIHLVEEPTVVVRQFPTHWLGMEEGP